MIHCKNINRITGLDFESYKLLPQYNHSFFKNEINGYAPPVKVTHKMQLGSLVDDILCNGNADMSSKLYVPAKKIAHKLKIEFDWLLPHCEKQVTYVGDMHIKINGSTFYIPVKGRPDMEKKNVAIFDFKVTDSKDIDGLIKFMKYENQQFCYGKLAQVQKSYLLIYSKPLDEVFVRPIIITETNKFWEEKILKFGKVCS